jgi:zinc protease
MDGATGSGHGYRGRVRRRRAPLRSLLVGLLAATAALAGCGQPGAGDEDHVDLGFEQYTLGNGLHVILRKDDRLPIAAVNLWYHVGPANEVAGRTGFAHLFEHMMFQGSGHTGKDAHFATLESVGASGVNGSTSYDRTNYMEDVPSGQLETALWLESDRMGYLLDSLDGAELANQQAVVRNERRERYDVPPYGLTDEAVFRALFPDGHPYHSHIIGSHADIQAAKLDDVRDFFKKYYVPNNASLSIVGNIDIAQTKQMIDKYFGTLPRGADVPQPQVAVPAHTTEQRITLTDQVQLPKVTMAWVTPPAFAPGDAEADVAARVLAGSRASRLYESMVQRTNIAQSVSAYQQSLRFGSVFEIEATAKPGHTAQELEAAIQRELDALGSGGPTEPELTAAKTKLRSDLLFGLEDYGAVADTFNRYDYYTGDAGYLERDLQRYSDVTGPAVQRFVSEQLAPSKRVVAWTVPGPKVLPPEPPTPPAPAATPDAARPASAEPWRSQKPAPVAAPKVQLPTAQRFELANGLPVYLVEQHSLPVAYASLTVRAGSAADPPEKPGLAKFTINMLEEGTTQRDGLGIARELDGLGAQLSPVAGDDGSSITVQALTQRMREAMAVMGDVARSPSFPQAETDRVRGETLTTLQQQRDDSSATADTVTREALYGDKHPYGHDADGTPASIGSITLDDLVAFHQTRYTPGNSALVLTGDLTLDQARDLADSTFGSWTGAGTQQPRPDAPPPPHAQVVVVDQPGAAQTSLVVGQPAVARDDPDYDKLRMMNAVLGGGFTSRVNLNLRERHGYTYGAFSQVTPLRGVGPFTVQAGVQTPVTGAAAKEMLTEVAGMQTVPATDEELSRARETITQSLPATFAKGSDVARAFGRLFLLDLPPDYYQRLPDALAGITPADIQATARAHLRPDQLTVVAVGDRATIEPQLAQLGLGPVTVRTPDGAPPAN